MGAALHGNLKDFGIAEVFQLIGQQRKTGLLEITGADHKVQLAFDEGAVVWAAPVGRTEFAVLGDRLVRSGLITRARLDELVRESESSARPLPTLLVSEGEVDESDIAQINDLLSRETIFEVMGWSGGFFHFDAQTIHHEMPPEKLLAAEQILMDGLRMLDEWQTFRSAVPSDDVVFRRAASMEEYRHRQGASPQEIAELDRVFQLVDGRLNARRIIDLSRLGTFEATRILADLVAAGTIEPLDEKDARRIRRQTQPSREVGRRVRWGLTAALPVVVLAGVVFLGLQSRPVATRLVGTPIARQPLEEVRQRFAARRLHNRIEVERMVQGGWPAALDELPMESGEDDLALTPSSSHPYYYVQRDGGFLLLAPER